MKFLIVGGESIGTRHINNLQNIGFKDIGCFKRCPDEDYAKKHDVIVITTESGVDEFNPDAIFICNPTSKHIEWTRIALKYDAAVFMEKPLTHSPEELNDFTSLWSGKVFFIGFMLRYHPLVSKIKELLDLGVIGDVFNARLEFGSYLPYWHPWEDYKISYASRKELGGGVVNTITHELDLAQFFFGMPKGVSAVTANFGRLGIGVEELAESLLIYDDKVVALHTDYLQKDYNRNIQILGDKGAISGDGMIMWLK